MSDLDTSRIRLTDPESGETNEYLIDRDGLATIRGPRKNPAPTRYSDPYAVVFTAGSERIARDRRLTLTDLRVLHALMARAPYVGHEFPAQPAKIGQLSYIRPSTVSATYTRLIDYGYLTRPRRGWLAFNPELIWRGGAASREKALAEKIASAQGAEEAMTWTLTYDE